jgi:hypothetical protein
VWLAGTATSSGSALTSAFACLLSYYEQSLRRSHRCATFVSSHGSTSGGFSRSSVKLGSKNAGRAPLRAPRIELLDVSFAMCRR